MDDFRAFRLEQTDDGVKTGFARLGIDDHSAGDVVIRVTHSTINYKDALAATGAARILRQSPLVGGIDLAGFVESSEDPELDPGTPVVVNGCGLSETRDGGSAEYARVPIEAVVPRPADIDPRALISDLRARLDDARRFL